MTFLAPGETLIAMSIGGTAAYRAWPGGVIGETGTRCGVGLAWLASAAGPGTRLVSVERRPARHAVARRVFAGDDR